MTLLLFMRRYGCCCCCCSFWSHTYLSAKDMFNINLQIYVKLKRRNYHHLASTHNGSVCVTNVPNSALTFHFKPQKKSAFMADEKKIENQWNKCPLTFLYIFIADDDDFDAALNSKHLSQWIFLWCVFSSSSSAHQKAANYSIFSFWSFCTFNVNQ